MLCLIVPARLSRLADSCAPAAVIGQAKLLPPEKMKHSIKLVDEQMNWCDSAMEVRPGATQESLPHASGATVRQYCYRVKDRC